MTCPKCNSENVSMQVVNEAILKTKHQLYMVALYRLVVENAVMAVPHIANVDH